MVARAWLPAVLVRVRMIPPPSMVPAARLAPVLVHVPPLRRRSLPPPMMTSTGLSPMLVRVTPPPMRSRLPRRHRPMMTPTRRSIVRVAVRCTPLMPRGGWGRFCDKPPQARREAVAHGGEGEGRNAICGCEFGELRDIELSVARAWRSVGGGDVEGGHFIRRDAEDLGDEEGEGVFCKALGGGEVEGALKRLFLRNGGEEEDDLRGVRRGRVGGW
jgi:hypothetical protein